MSAVSDFVKRLSEQAADDGNLMALGFGAFALACINKDAPAIQVQEMRIAFMAGAQHLFASMMAVMDADREPTERDLARMSLIDKELRRFVEEMKLRAAVSGGSA